MTTGGPLQADALCGPVRANPAYRLRPISALAPRERASLAAWGVDAASAFGVLSAAPASNLATKVVDAAAAELFAGLAAPATVPDDLRHRLALLVLDSVLEVRTASGFLTGPAAYDVLADEAPPATGNDRLSRLVRDAVDHAGRLQLSSVELLAERLYGYHRVPLSRRWASRYPTPAAVLALLPERVLSRHWTTRTPPGHTHWLAWTRRTGGGPGHGDRLPYKVYVSPVVEALPDVLPAVVLALTRTTAPQFKVGSDATGLLRPDKLVVYLRDAGEASEVVDALSEVLDGVDPHGVPFTAGLAHDGLVSWGGDPPQECAPVGSRAESWRLSVCRRLAEGLVAAQQVRLSRTSPADFALAKLGADGVDVQTFAPTGLPAPRRSS